jgi:response regulator RpfG family c-di-GMP phosphodiesterase
MKTHRPIVPNLAQLSNVPIGDLLIVDDEENNRMLLRDTLEAQGHTVREAESGAAALRLIEENPPDAVLLDVMMPQMDGYEVCRRIKESSVLAHVPVLLITALTDRKERLTGIQAGANDFISKPIDLTDVTLRVRNAVQTKKLFDSLEAAYQQSVDVHALQQKIVQLIIRDTQSPLCQALELLEPLRQRPAKSANAQRSVERACQILGELSKRFDQLLSSTAASSSPAKAA